MNLQELRIELIQSIIQKDPTKYGYLGVQPFVTTITNNYHHYPNIFLQTLLQKIYQFGQYHQQVMLDDPFYGVIYRQFITDYQNCCQYFQMQLQMQNFQHMQNFAQTPQHYQQNFSQNNNQDRKCHGKRKNHGRTYNDEDYQEGGYHHGHGDGYHRNSHKREFLEDGVKQKFRHGKEWRHKDHHKKHKHHKDRQNQSSSENSNHSKNKKKREKKQKAYRKQESHHSNKLQSQKKNNQVEQKNPQAIVSRQKAIKPEPKPTKYSMKELRSFVSQWSQKNKYLVSKELIEQINAVKTWARGETDFEEGNDSNEEKKELTEEEKAELIKKSLTQLVENLSIQNLDDSLEKTVQILSSDVTLFELVADTIGRVMCSEQQHMQVYVAFGKKICQLHEKDLSSNKVRQQRQKNSFRMKLTKKIQVIFEKQLNQKVKFRNESERESYVQDSRKRLIPIVKTIATLIKKGVVKHKIARACIEDLTHKCLQKYYFYRKKPIVQNSNYHVYYEALIQFIYQLGRGFETLSRDVPEIEEGIFDSLYSKIVSLIDMRTSPENCWLTEFKNISTDDIFTLIEVIDEKVIGQELLKVSSRQQQVRILRENKWRGGPLEPVEKYIEESQQRNKILEQKPDGQRDPKKLQQYWSQMSQYQYISHAIQTVQGCQRHELQKYIQFLREALAKKFTLSNVKSAWYGVLEKMSEEYEVTELGLEILSKIVAQIARAYHEPKEFLRPKTTDENLNSLYDRILCFKIRR